MCICLFFLLSLCPYCHHWCSPCPNLTGLFCCHARYLRSVWSSQIDFRLSLPVSPHSLSELSSSDSVSSPFFLFWRVGWGLGCWVGRRRAKLQPSSLDATRRWNLLLISSSPLKRFLAFLSSWISHQRVTFSPFVRMPCLQLPARLILYSVSAIGFIHIFINNWALCCNALRAVWFRDFWDSVAMMRRDTPAPAARFPLTSWWCGLVKCRRPRGSSGRSEGRVLVLLQWNRMCFSQVQSLVVVVCSLTSFFKMIQSNKGPIQIQNMIYISFSFCEAFPCDKDTEFQYNSYCVSGQSPFKGQ